MSETTSGSFWQFRLPSAAMILLFATYNASGSMPALRSNIAVVKDGINADLTASKSEQLSGENTSWKAARAMQIKALRGKYRDVLTPSDEFAQQKLLEIAIER